VFFDRDIEVARTAELILQFFNGGTDFFHTVDDSVRDGRGTVVVVTLFRLGNVESVEDLLGLLGVLSLLGKSMVEEDVTSLLLNVTDAITTGVAHLNQIGIVFLGQSFNHFLCLFG
jgi:hypothetical protein